MKKVYLCAPLGGDVTANLEKIRQYCRYALLCGTAPVVPHFYAECLDDSVPAVSYTHLTLPTILLV